MFATLLILMPEHGSVSYKWERRNERAGVWQLIEVPPYTCLLYVDLPGDYRCQVGERKFYFIVLCRGMIVHGYCYSNSMNALTGKKDEQNDGILYGNLL